MGLSSLSDRGNGFERGSDRDVDAKGGYYGYRYFEVGCGVWGVGCGDECGGRVWGMEKDAGVTSYYPIACMHHPVKRSLNSSPYIQTELTNLLMNLELPKPDIASSHQIQIIPTPHTLPPTPSPHPDP